MEVSTSQMNFIVSKNWGVRVRKCMQSIKVVEHLLTLVSLSHKELSSVLSNICSRTL